MSVAIQAMNPFLQASCNIVLVIAYKLGLFKLCVVNTEGPIIYNDFCVFRLIVSIRGLAWAMKLCENKLTFKAWLNRTFCR